jgi:membrane protease YdiL (CAAX protease family)
MQKLFIRILTWLGIMAVLTLLTMGAWMIVSGGSQSTVSLKWFQFVQTIGTFLLPPILCAWLWDENHKPFHWLHLNKGADWQSFVLAIGIMICAIPAINLLADLNSRIDLPDSLDFIEQKFKAYEASAAALTERFLQADNVAVLLLNIGLMALLPALAEELSFRGTLQQLLGSKHLAIWITAVIFSAIHIQFYGFIPRMLMGAMFGYVFVWTGSLWVPIVMHFTNNGLAVLAFYVFGTENSYADTIGAGATWWLGVISLIITSLGLPIFFRRTRKQ